jgi:hypothetical protein
MYRFPKMHKQGCRVQGRREYTLPLRVYWFSEVSEAASNYLELLNLVEALEIQVRDGNFKWAKIYLFTDNSTAEVNLSSSKLFGLVQRLGRLEMAA